MGKWEGIYLYTVQCIFPTCCSNSVSDRLRSCRIWLLWRLHVMSEQARSRTNVLSFQKDHTGKRRSGFKCVQEGRGEEKKKEPSKLECMNRMNFLPAFFLSSSWLCRGRRNQTVVEGERRRRRRRRGEKEKINYRRGPKICTHASDWERRKSRSPNACKCVALNLRLISQEWRKIEVVVVADQIHQDSRPRMGKFITTKLISGIY